MVGGLQENVENAPTESDKRATHATNSGRFDRCGVPHRC